VQHSGRRSNRRDNGIELFAYRFFQFPPFFEVFHLVVPLFEIGIPESAHIDSFEIRIQEIFDIRDGRFARSFEFADCILRPEVSFDSRVSLSLWGITAQPSAAKI
jgi:hypothetical protein